MSEAVPPSSSTLPPQLAATPQTIPSNSQPAPAEPVGRGTILQLPPNTPQLPRGERLEGTVTQRLTATQLVITTRLGPITVQTDTALPQGARILLLTASAGKKPAVQISTLGQSSTPVVSPNVGNTPGQAPVAPPPQAVSQRAAGVPQAAPPAFADNQTQIRGSIVSATVVRTTVGRGNATVRSAVRPLVNERLNAPPIKVGTRLSVRIAAISQPGTGAAPAPPGTASITGTVTGTDISGNALVRTNQLELAISTPRPLPIGSNLLLQTIGRPAPLFASSASPHTLATSPRWETLQEALRSIGPTAAQGAIAQAIPQTGAQFTNALLFFIAALRAGDMRGWLGAEATRGIEREALFGRMIEEFGLMQRLANEPGGQEWRLFLLPVLSEEQLHQLRLFVRDNQENGTDDQKAKETRFVIEVTFSKLGPFQFDGLARSNALELIIRTEHELAGPMQHEIAEIFADTTSALGLNGSVAFRTEAFFQLQPLRDSGLAEDSGVVA